LSRAREREAPTSTFNEGYVLIPFGKTKAAGRKLALSERAYSYSS
jgi:hypothetical protein